MKTMAILFLGIVLSMKNKPIWRGNLALEHSNLVWHICSFVKCIFFYVDGHHMQCTCEAQWMTWWTKQIWPLHRVFQKIRMFCSSKKTHLDSVCHYSWKKSLLFSQLLETDKSYCNFLLLQYAWVIDKIINDYKWNKNI